jgi:outer membrane lipoprotein
MIARWLATLALTLALAGCATVKPAFDTLPANAAPPPFEVAKAPERFLDRPVVWGGMIVEVRNYERHSEFEILAFPLDDKQRPMLEQRDYGRFIAIVPGYAEAGDWPVGRYLSLIGRITGERRGAVRQAEYVYPEVDIDRVHLWSRDFRNPGPRISFGIGVGF